MENETLSGNTFAVAESAEALNTAPPAAEATAPLKNPLLDNRPFTTSITHASHILSPYGLLI
ncbi:hypothetical protein PSE_p0142 (plasmid) [Pseudovibrio sp. FO-BEG1]|nr:hypothetical protein PSE_p0142 [Pseudovibrio sp. FO-BEG1]